MTAPDNVTQSTEGLPAGRPNRNSRPWARYGDWVIAVVLFTATIISRIPFRSRTLYGDDSSGFALGLEDFDLLRQRPHPPGYIIYIAAGRVFNIFFNDANAALVALSIFSAAVAVVGIYFMGKSIFGRTEGIIAAILLFFSPLFWLYSEVALTYAVGVPPALLITWLLYQMFFHRRYAILCGIVMGLAAGLRQDLLIYFAPVFFFASWRVGWRRMLVSWGAVLLGVAIWLIPLIMSVGDLGQFIEVQSRQYDQAVLPYSFFEKGATALATNGKEIFKALIWLLGPAVLMLIVSLLRIIKLDRKAVFLLCATLPSLAAFLLFFLDPPAYLLICAPAIILLAAQAIAQASRTVARFTGNLRFPLLKHPPVQRSVVATALVLVSTWVSFTAFLSGSTTLDKILPGTPGYEFLFITHNANGIKARNDTLLAAIAAVEQYEPESTVVVCNIADNVFNWSRLMYYLPEYRVIGIHLIDDIDGDAYKDGQHHVNLTRGGGVIELAPQVERVIFIGQEIVGDSYLDFSDNVVVREDSLLRPDRFAPSLIVVAEPLDSSFKLGRYTFTRPS